MRRIGEGNFGTVYRMAPRIGATYALKVFKQDPESQEKAAHEVCILEKIKSSGLNTHVIEIITSDLNQTPVSITMEYAAGGSLRDYLSGWPLHLRQYFHSFTGYNQNPLLEKLHYLLHITKGLSTLHQLNIIHRDLNADNIVFVFTHGQWIAKICDLGNSIHLPSGTRESSVVATDIPPTHPLHYGCVTTLVYAAPEIFKNKSGRKYSKASDIYALGVLFYVVFSQDFNFLKNIHQIPDFTALLAQIVDSNEALVPPIEATTAPLCIQRQLKAMYAQNPLQRPEVAAVQTEIETYLSTLLYS